MIGRKTHLKVVDASLSIILAFCLSNFVVQIVTRTADKSTQGESDYLNQNRYNLFGDHLNNFERNWRPPNPDPSAKLAGRLDQLRSTLRLLEPGLVAARSGASWQASGPDRGELHVPLWGQVCIFPFPELVEIESHNMRLPDLQQALLLYYLVTADGTSLTGNWVSFADLPDGRLYNSAFQGYSGDEISKRFCLDLEVFKIASIKSGGNFIDIGSASFIFQPLPRVPLMVTYWLGDEDFPSSCKILFDASACHYLPVDACAVLGSMLTHKLICA